MITKISSEKHRLVAIHQTFVEEFCKAHFKEEILFMCFNQILFKIEIIVSFSINKFRIKLLHSDLNFKVFQKVNFRVKLYYFMTLQMLKLNDQEFLGEGGCVLSEVSCLGLSQLNNAAQFCMFPMFTIAIKSVRNYITSILCNVPVKIFE